MGTDEQWRAWGKVDPYFAVITLEQFRRGKIEDNWDEFFRGGETQVARFLSDATANFGPISTERALDFGCGVGRLTLPLAERFNQVVGVDISPDMLAEAGKNAASLGLKNTEFVISDDALGKVAGHFDFVLSYIVLQHLPARRGLAIMEQLLERVSPNGIVMLQFSVKRGEGVLGRPKYFVKHQLPQVAAALRFLAGRGWSTLTMRMTEYDLTAVLALFSRRGFKSVMLTEDYQNEVLTYQLTSKRTF